MFEKGCKTKDQNPKQLESGYVFCSKSFDVTVISGTWGKQFATKKSRNHLVDELQWKGIKKIRNQSKLNSDGYKVKTESF